MSKFILFREDWLDFPSAKPHYESKNESALVLAKKLQLMGIKNHLFFLALLDPALANVDPHADDLDEETMYRIGIECRRNPWYYFREVARAPALAGTQSERVQFNRSNVCLW